MNAELLKTILVTAFGGQTARPWRTALWRLALATLGALAAGFYLSHGLGALPLASDLPGLWAAVFIGLISFLVIGIIGLILKSTPVYRRGSYDLGALAAVWPLSKIVIWSLEALPLLVIWSLTSITGVWLTLTVADVSGQPASILCLGWTIGGLSGLSLALWHLAGWLRSMILVGVISGGFYWLELALRYQSVKYAFWPIITGVGVIIIYGLSLARQSQAATPKPASNLLQLPPKLINQGWFGLKILRNSRSGSSLLVALSICYSSAIIAQWRQPNTSERLSWLFLGAAISMAFTSDIRGLYRRYKSPEVNLCKLGSLHLRHKLPQSHITKYQNTKPSRPPN